MPQSTMTSGRLLRVVVIMAVVVEGSCSAMGVEPSAVRTPDQRFVHLPRLGYPWTPRYILQKVPGLSMPLRVHYIDEGPRDANETLLLLHGTPAWSFLYRSVIPGLLSAGYRVVALDQIGFGRSDKLTNINSYSHQLHVATVQLLMKTLCLQGVTLVAHDLGGLTGVSAMFRDPGCYRRVVLLNTWLPQGDIFTSLSRVTEHTAFLLWRGVVGALGHLQPVEIVFTVASEAPMEAISGGYGAPFPSPLYKAGPASWPLIIPLSENEPMAHEMRKAAEFLSGWSGPALLGYSDGEVFTLPGMALLQRVLPHACQIQIPDAGHFLQEDQGPLIARTIVSFIEKGCSLELLHLAPLDDNSVL